MRNSRARWIAVVGMSAALLHAACGAPPPDPRVPEVDTTKMEPRVAEAIREARESLLGDPASADRWGRLGMVFHAHHLNPQAFECYRVASDMEPETLRWAYLAALVVRRSDAAMAIDYFERAAALQPDFQAFHVKYGDALLVVGDVEGARAQYERALGLEEESVHALYGMGQTDVARGDLASARQQLERAVAVAPKDANVQSLLSQVYMRLGEPQRAERASLIARVGGASPLVDTLDVEVWTLSVSTMGLSDRGRKLADQGRYAGAEELFRRVIEISPDAAGHATLAALYLMQGKLDAAVASYESALQLDPDAVNIHRQLALALADRGELERAAAHAETAARLDPDSAEVHHTLGLLQKRKGNLAGALAGLNRALKLQPAMATARSDLGQVLMTLGRPDEAMAQWRLAVSLDPDDLLAHFNLGLALIVRGEHAEAVRHLEVAYRLAPLGVRVVGALAWELATAPDDRVRDGTRARELAATLHRQFPDDPQYADMLAAALAETGRFEEAAAVARDAARLAASLGRPDQAPRPRSTATDLRVGPRLPSRAAVAR